MNFEFNKHKEFCHHLLSIINTLYPTHLKPSFSNININYFLILKSIQIEVVVMVERGSTYCNAHFHGVPTFISFNR